MRKERKSEKTNSDFSERTGSRQTRGWPRQKASLSSSESCLALWSPTTWLSSNAFRQRPRRVLRLGSSGRSTPMHLKWHVFCSVALRYFSLRDLIFAFKQSRSDGACMKELCFHEDQRRCHIGFNLICRAFQPPPHNSSSSHSSRSHSREIVRSTE